MAQTGATMIIFGTDEVPPGAMSFEAFLSRGVGIEVGSLQTGVSGSDPCLIVYTSGSSGKPKGALLRQGAIKEFAEAQNRLWPVEPYRTINYFPINHIGSLVDCSMPVLAAGGTIVFMESFDASQCLSLMVKERITYWGSVPSAFQLQLAAPDFPDYDLSHVQLIVWEGAAMQPDTLEQLAAICPKMATNYGMTETTSAITATPVTSDLARLVNGVGSEFEGIEIRIADNSDQPIADGEEGEVQVRSDRNLVEYWRNPHATANAFTSDGFFRTGDLAIRQIGGDLKIVGRKNEAFKSGGYNVYPREVEAMLETHPAVAAAVVVPVPDPLWQEVGFAFVTLSAPISVDDITKYCRDNIASYKLPKFVHIQKVMPLLAIGKIDRKELKKIALDRQSSSQ
jgi:acyl-CoA synthetase (AMP-forming)/AMP-acid ligase II